MKKMIIGIMLIGTLTGCGNNNSQISVLNDPNETTIEENIITENMLRETIIEEKFESEY